MFYVIISLVVNIVFIVVPFFALVVLNRAAIWHVYACAKIMLVLICSVLRCFFSNVGVGERCVCVCVGGGGSSFVPVKFVTVCADLS